MGTTIGRSDSLRGNALLLRAVLTLVLLVPPPGLAGQSSPAWRLEEAIRIGDVDGPLAFTQIKRIVSVDTVLFVAQSQERVIRVISKDGALLRTLGRAGDGPGEFRRIDYLGFVDGELVAIDLGSRRRTFYTPDGELVGTLPLPQPRAAYPLLWIGAPYAAQDRNVILTGSVARDELPEVPVVLANSDNQIQDTLAWFDPSRLGFGVERDGRRVGFRHPLRREESQSVSPDGRFFVDAKAVGDNVGLTWFDMQTRARMTREIASPRVRVPDQFADSMEHRIWEILQPRGFTPRDVREALALPESVIGADVVQAVNGGGVWLREPSFTSTDRVWRLVSREGGDELRVVAPASIRIFDQDESLIWARDTDELGVNYVVGLRLVPMNPSR